MIQKTAVKIFFRFLSQKCRNFYFFEAKSRKNAKFQIQNDEKKPQKWVKSIVIRGIPFFDVPYKMTFRSVFMPPLARRHMLQMPFRVNLYMDD